jgi:hypothetical protein
MHGVVPEFISSANCWKANEAKTLDAPSCLIQVDGMETKHNGLCPTRPHDVAGTADAAPLVFPPRKQVLRCHFKET